MYPPKNEGGMFMDEYLLFMIERMSKVKEEAYDLLTQVNNLDNLNKKNAEQYDNSEEMEELHLQLAGKCGTLIYSYRDSKCKTIKSLIKTYAEGIYKRLFCYWLDHQEDDEILDMCTALQKAFKF